MWKRSVPGCKKSVRMVDLGIATMVPLQLSAVYPRFLTNEPRIVGDKFDWSPCTYSQTQKDDCPFLSACIIDVAPAKGEYVRVYSEILAHDGQEERYEWLSAVNRLDIVRGLKTKPQLLHIGDYKISSEHWQNQLKA
jgi:hypothetical protein